MATSTFPMHYHCTDMWNSHSHLIDSLVSYVSAAYNMVTEVAKHAPQVFAQSLPAIVQCFESDDSMAAEAAAQVLAVAGSFIFHAASDGSAEPVTVPDSIINQIKDIALSGTPKGAKAAVKALALALGPEGSTALLRQVCTKLHASLSKDNAGRPHTRILAELKAMSMALRMNPTLLVEFADGLHQCVMQHLLNTDLSG